MKFINHFQTYEKSNKSLYCVYVLLIILVTLIVTTNVEKEFK